MIPIVIAHGPNLLIAVPLAVLWLLGLYGLPAMAYSFAKRRKKAFALLVGAVGTVISGYALTTQFPADGEEVVVWLFIGVIPFLGSLLALLAGLRVRSSTEAA